jgi:hypothetical protein
MAFFSMRVIDVPGVCLSQAGGKYLKSGNAKILKPEGSEKKPKSGKPKSEIKNLRTPPKPVVLGVAFSRSAWHGLLP